MAVIAPDGNVLGTPATIPLDLAGGRQHPGRAAGAAISALITSAGSTVPGRS